MAHTSMMLALLFMSIVAPVVADFFGENYQGSILKSSTGFLVEYFNFNPLNEYVAYKPALTCTGSSCDGLAAEESKYASADLGSPPGRKWVRVSAAITPSLEFNLMPSNPLNNVANVNQVTAEEWFGYYYPKKEQVFDVESGSWGMRISGVIKTNMVASRIRIKIDGGEGCWSYTLRNSTSIQYVAETPLKYFTFPKLTQMNFLFEIRFICSGVKTVSVRWIPQRWFGPSRLFLSPMKLSGNSGLTAFDQACTSQGPFPPTLGIWQAFLWNNDDNYKQRFGSIVYPLMHRSGDRVFPLGDMNNQLPDNGRTPYHDAFGDWDSINDGPIWINNTAANCGNWSNWNATGHISTTTVVTGGRWMHDDGLFPCNQPASFFCAEIFPVPTPAPSPLPQTPPPPNCSMSCSADLIPCARVCERGQPCRTDRDCSSGNCGFGQCIGLDRNKSYCVIKGALAPIFSICTDQTNCTSGNDCVYFYNTDYKSCVVAGLSFPLETTTSPNCSGLDAIQPIGNNTVKYPSTQPFVDDPCPPRYQVQYNSATGSQCTYNSTSTCCGPYLPCVPQGNCADSLANAQRNDDPVRFILRPHYYIMGASKDKVVADNVGFQYLCYAQCVSEFGDKCASFSRMKGAYNCRVSTSSVLKWGGSTSDSSWLVISNGDQDFQPFAELSVSHNVPQHSFKADVMFAVGSFMRSLSSTKPMFIPSLGNFSDYFCLSMGIQCIGSAGEFLLPDETAVEFNIMLPAWQLESQFGFVPCPFGLRHLDLSFNPDLHVQISTPDTTLRTVDLLGTGYQERPECNWLSTPNIFVTRWADHDMKSCLSKWPNTSVQVFVVHKRDPNITTVTVLSSQLKALILLNGKFPGAPADNFVPPRYLLNLSDSTPLTLFISIGTDFDPSGLRKFNMSLKSLKLYSCPQQTFDDVSSSISMQTQLQSLVMVGSTNYTSINNITFSGSALPKLRSLWIEKMKDFSLKMDAGSLPVLESLTISQIKRPIAFPVDKFLFDMNCCGLRQNLTQINFDYAMLRGVIPASSFLYSKYDKFRLSGNFLSSSHPLRNFPIQVTLFGEVETYLRSWEMLPGYPTPTGTGAASRGEIDIMYNHGFRGYGPAVSCTAGNCPLPATTYCDGDFSVHIYPCTPFWLLEQWVTSQNTVIATPPPQASNETAFPPGKIRVYALVYGSPEKYARPWKSYQPLPHATDQPNRISWVPDDLRCWLAYGDGSGGAGLLGSLQVSNTSLPMVMLASCDFNISLTTTNSSAPMPGLFGIFHKDTLTRFQQAGGAPNYDAQNSSSTLITIDGSLCAPGSCKDAASQTCLDCPAGTFGDGTAACLANTTCEVCPGSNLISLAGSDTCYACLGAIRECDANGCRCKPCNPGTISINGSPCQDCPAGRSAPMGSSVCTNCDRGTFAAVNGTTCDVCVPGKIAPNVSATSCTECTTGKYGPSPGVECLECPNGREAKKNGTAVCDQCQAGTYFMSGGPTTGCRSCEIGKQQPQKAASQCDGCPPGTFAASTGTIQCPACQAGTFAEGNQISCTACAPGRYQNATGRADCVDCAAGKAAEREGLRDCGLCEAGYFVNRTKALFCEACEAGTFASVTGMTRCLGCAPGTYSMYAGQLVCQQCDKGRYTNVTARTGCALCELGTFGNANGMSSCALCPAGSDSSTPGVTSCASCVPGRAGLRCKACSPGKWQSEVGKEDCDFCVPGKYSDEATSTTGATSCTDCPAGTYGNATPGNRSSCVTCPFGSTSPLGNPSASNCTCVEGTYGSSVNGSGPVCLTCKGCAVCPGGPRPFSPPGCFLTQGVVNEWEGISCSPAEACLGAELCAPEYKGGLCHQCQSAHYRADGKCVPCPDNAGGFWVLMILLLFLITLFLLRFSRPNLSKINSIGIFLSGVQIISVFGYLPVPYPETTAQMFSVLSAANFNLDLFSPECSTKMDFYGLWVFKLCLPLFFGAALGIIFLVIKISPRARYWFYRIMADPKLRQPAREKITRDVAVPVEALDQSQINWAGGEEMSQDYVPSDADRFIYCIVSLLSLLYTFLSATASQPFQCIPVGLDFVLARDASVRCYTSEWDGYASLAAIMLLVYTAGIPSTLFYFLYRGNQANRVQDAEFLSRFGSLVVAYRSQFFFWEIVDMARKAGVVCCIAFLPVTSDGDKTLQINLIFLLTFGFFLAQVMTNPFEYNFCNRLCFVWLTTTLLTLVSALLFRSPQIDEGDALAYAIFLLFIVLFSTATTLYVAIREIRRAYWRATMERRTGVSTLSRRRMQKALLGQIFEGFSHDVWRKMRIYNDEESLKFFHYLAQGLQPSDQPELEVDDSVEKMDGVPVQRAAARSIAHAKKNLLSDEDLQESDRAAHMGGIELVRAGAPVALA